MFRAYTLEQPLAPLGGGKNMDATPRFNYYNGKQILRACKKVIHTVSLGGDCSEKLFIQDRVVNAELEGSHSPIVH